MNYNKQRTTVNFIWSISNDILRNTLSRKDHRNVILAFTVLRRLDAVSLSLHKKGQRAPEYPQFFHGISDVIFEQSIINSSPFTLHQLLDLPGSIYENLLVYLDGFQDDVKEIIDKLSLYSQLKKLDKVKLIRPLIERFCSGEINLSPLTVLSPKDNITLEGFSTIEMGYLFEELVNKFNENYSEEAGEHFTPNDIIELVISLVFEPERLNEMENTLSIYDPAIGCGGLLTSAQRFIREIFPDKIVRIYGQEVNPEIYAICKADMMIKGIDWSNVKFGSTLSNDVFQGLKFDFMLSNPPHGRSWKIEKKNIINRSKIIDKRFASGLPRISDSQLLFLMDMVSKMKDESEFGSRIISIQNGASLYTGGPNSGENEMRRYLIENDWIEAIIQLPDGMFYNTGIPTYIWLLSNKKENQRKDKIQLIDASKFFLKMKRKIGQKNKKLNKHQIKKISNAYLNFTENEFSKIFTKESLGIFTITINYPLRLSWRLDDNVVIPVAYRKDFYPIFNELQRFFGNREFKNFNLLKNELNNYLISSNLTWDTKLKKLFFKLYSWQDETAEPVVKKKLKNGTIIYEYDKNLQQKEELPMTEDINDFFRREILPDHPDAWVDHDKTINSYDLSFYKYFIKLDSTRSLGEIKEDLLAIEMRIDELKKKIIN